MKPLLDRILELLEDKARRLFDPESSRAIPSKAPVKSHADETEQSNK